MQYIETLQGITSHIDGDKENTELDIAIWQADSNICELHDPQHMTQVPDTGECLTTHGIYFGTSDGREPKFCPAHFFSDLGYKIEPTDEVKQANQRGEIRTI